MVSRTTEWVVMIGFAQFGGLACALVLMTVAGGSAGNVGVALGILLGAAVGVYVLKEANEAGTANPSLQPPFVRS